MAGVLAGIGNRIGQFVRKVKPPVPGVPEVVPGPDIRSIVEGLIGPPVSADLNVREKTASENMADRINAALDTLTQTKKPETVMPQVSPIEQALSLYGISQVGAPGVNAAAAAPYTLAAGRANLANERALASYNQTVQPALDTLKYAVPSFNAMVDSEAAAARLEEQIRYHDAGLLAKAHSDELRQNTALLTQIAKLGDNVNPNTLNLLYHELYANDPEEVIQAKAQSAWETIQANPGLLTKGRLALQQEQSAHLARADLDKQILALVKDANDSVGKTPDQRLDAMHQLQGLYLQNIDPATGQADPRLAFYGMMDEATMQQRAQGLSPAGKLVDARTEALKEATAQKKALLPFLQREYTDKHNLSDARAKLLSEQTYWMGPEARAKIAQAMATADSTRDLIRHRKADEAYKVWTAGANVLKAAATSANQEYIRATAQLNTLIQARSKEEPGSDAWKELDTKVTAAEQVVGDALTGLNGIQEELKGAEDELRASGPGGAGGAAQKFKTPYGEFTEAELRSQVAGAKDKARAKRDFKTWTGKDY